MAVLLPLLDTLRLRCATIDALWRDNSFDYFAFPQIVYQATEDLDLTPFGRVEDVVQLLENPEIAALQRLSSFSDLYVKLFDNRRFWVEILNWWGSDINIHDHDFAGIQFQLSGCSLNVGYGFDQYAQEAGIAYGELSIQSAAIWKPGDRSIVEPGRKAPHNVCHIGVPTVSLLIRTHPNSSFGPQWNYFPPGLASSYGIATASFRKRVQTLRLLARGDQSTFSNAFRWFSSRATNQELLFALVKMVDILFEPNRVSLLYELARSSTTVERIIEAVVLYRAVESVKYLKNTTPLRWKAQLALSVIASGSSRDQFRRVTQLLRENGFEPGFDDPWTELSSPEVVPVIRRLGDTFSVFDEAA